MKGCKTFEISIFLDFGGYHLNSAEDYEVAHFLEHLVAPLPSSKYPNVDDNLQLLRERGIEWNATTYDRHTRYYYRGMSRHLKKVLSLVLSCHCDFIINESIFEKERSAILNELRMKMSNPGHVFWECAHAFLYQNLPHLARFTLQARYHNTSKLTSDYILGKRKAYCTGRNVLFVVAGGGFSTSQVVDAFTKAIKKYPSRKPLPLPHSGKFDLNGGPMVTKITVPAQKNTKVWVLWLMPFRASDHSRVLHLWLIRDLMIGLSGRLTRLLRIKLGYVYSLASHLDADEDNRIVFGFGTEVNNSSHVQHTLELMVRELERIQPIKESEMEALKAIYEYRDEREAQEGRGSPTYWVNQLALNQLKGLPSLTPSEKQSIITSTTPTDLERLSRKSFVKEKRIVFVGLPGELQSPTQREKKITLKK